MALRGVAMGVAKGAPVAMSTCCGCWRNMAAEGAVLSGEAVGAATRFTGAALERAYHNQHHVYSQKTITLGIAHPRLQKCVLLPGKRTPKALRFK
jgi:hypothetical protein